MYHKIRWIRISNKDKSRIKVDTIDKFRPFRACYVFFFFSTTFHKLFFLSEKDHVDFREIASHTRAPPVQIERTRVAFKLEAFKNLTPHPSPSRVKTLIHFPSRLLFSTLCPEETGRRRGARGDRRNYHNHFSWLGKKKKEKTTRAFSEHQPA